MEAVERGEGGRATSCGRAAAERRLIRREDVTGEVTLLPPKRKARRAAKREG